MRPPPAPPAVVDIGDLAEQEETWHAHRATLAAAYGVQGPIEEQLLDRVAELTWRLARLPRVERGAIGIRTLGVTQRRTREQREGLALDRLNAMTQPGGALHHPNPQLLADALRDLRSLREEVEARIDIDYRAAVRTLATVFGIGPDQQVGGRGHALAAYLYQLGLRTNGNWAQEDGSPEASAALEVRIRRFVVSELREIEAGVAEMVRWQRQDAARLDRAHAEANALPETSTLRDLIAYERHLGGELRVARAELERMVARRRLAGVGVAVLQR